MTIPRFEGSFLGDVSRLPANAKLECKICWHVYDPAEGCDYWQVPAGTPFARLPDHWRCPRCDGARDQFMVIDAADAPAAIPVPAVPDPLAALAAEAARRFEATFREIHAGQMRGVPLVNETLGVRAIGFRPYEGRIIGVLVTPWFMNIVLVPGPDDNWAKLVTGSREILDFPSGEYEFLGANRTETGPYKACSLFSPMLEFTSMLQAEDTARAALAALFDPALRDDEADGEAATSAPPQTVTPLAEPSRRTLIFGGSAAGRDARP
ncbi:[NiFe]-hydrogenase assembly chaperone HybE [Segnochrobactrum spirostomi]|uniref:[NiFe]-hydrogenase assembly chaperone HybE n=1 Tax=Segnochrobactrum spirostomi TaxID=2608987 RepID=A0A6A7YBL5_9HYPH|nr:[NiFe]-hydrogenase assembly chaperone HybE [Segnochrobactrum spirostomi]MQT15358.1 [NiFe]-hydrogenase assembly chaperone HybE [Segnochrobactrum spirostomi]